MNHRHLAHALKGIPYRLVHFPLVGMLERRACNKTVARPTCYGMPARAQAPVPSSRYSGANGRSTHALRHSSRAWHSQPASRPLQSLSLWTRDQLIYRGCRKHSAELLTCMHRYLATCLHTQRRDSLAISVSTSHKL